ncbi:hypothetical protein [Catellatospora sp. IY07-71]|uniref:hypothetical protein n=1 Tax=Catellatospora sp. IY07-71 TaxID=2728827 RepID=UPI001BB3093E|nr:hypothetical protein [Catellatospora sp. IY07-71]
MFNWAAALAMAIFAASFLIVGVMSLLPDDDTWRTFARHLGRLLLWAVCLGGLFLWAFWRSLPILAIWAAVLGPLLLVLVGGRIGTLRLARLADRRQ